MAKYFTELSYLARWASLHLQQPIFEPIVYN